MIHSLLNIGGFVEFFHSKKGQTGQNQKPKENEQEGSRDTCNAFRGIVKQENGVVQEGKTQKKNT